MRSVDDRVARNLSGDRPISAFERRVAAQPARTAVVGAVVCGLVVAASVELLRPYPQLNNFLLLWLMVGGIFFGFLAMAARVTESRVDRHDEGPE